MELYLPNDGTANLGPIAARPGMAALLFFNGRLDLFL
jgi:hypothetical protein